MDIVIHCLGMPFGPTTVYEQSLGGSESAAFYLAKGLAARGHRVSLFTTREAPLEIVDGVRYVWIGPSTQETPLGRDFEFFARTTPHDVLIIQRIPGAFSGKFAAKVCIWQLHDLALRRFGGQVLAGTWQLDAVTCVSQWHADQVKAAWMIDPSVLFVVPNGVDHELYEPVKDARPFVRITDDEPGRTEESFVVLPRGKFHLLYQSRPERGLEHLVRPGGIMDRLRDLPVHLTLCAYANTVPQMRELYDKWFAWARALPNVSFVGALTKPQLAELQRKSDLLVYPTEFEEVSCITAMEAMHASLPMLSSAQAALVETCADSGVDLLPLKDGKADEDAFVEWISARFSDISNYPSQLQRMGEYQREAAERYTWTKAVDRLEACIRVCFARREGNPGAVLRTAIERSDIDFARWYLEKTVSGETASAIEQSASDEIGRLYKFTQSDSAYQAHYDKHQGLYYDGPGAQAVGEDVTESSRFRGVYEFLHRELENKPRKRVLDYGCAHGHYTIPLAKEFIGHDFHGVDISERAVEAAQGWAEKDHVKNVKFKVGSEDYLAGRSEMDDEKKYDVILAAEVLEHVRDWRLFLEMLASCLKPGGALIITTPSGRWEHSGTVAFRTGREHLVHLERQDILDICQGHESDIMYAPAGADASDEQRGSWVWFVKPARSGPEQVWFSGIDYERKRAEYCPRDTISACLIVKDGELTLRKCIESIVDWVDEVRIFIDPTTKDRTAQVCAEICDDFPNRPVMWDYLEKSVIESGFDEARNASMADASGDWILWCDADEEIHGAPLLHKLARQCMHDGYGFAQLHYSLEPPEVLTTDFPTRFFRNRKGIKFYGVVHEHPELVIGQAVPTSIIRPEVKFLHCGYVSESVRHARYERNFPLLKRDREKHPTRKLNQFLWMRDVAQTIAFFQQRFGGVTREHIDMAREAVSLFESMIPGSPCKILSDTLPYYSFCVQTLGEGFDTEVTFKTVCAAAPNLSVQSSINGRFHNRAFHQRFVNYFLEESTKSYEQPYL